MSGLEVVGVVLGVLPLLISAAEHYEDVFKPFRRFQKCAPELEMYQKQLKTQKMIFLNQCQLHLTALTSRESAKEMLRERDHPSWNDEKLRRRVIEQLGTSRDACEATVQMIAGKLTSIESDAESFGAILQESIPLRSFGDKAWRSRIHKKLKFCFSESRLNEYLDDLRKLNQDFRTLAKQTGRLDRQQSGSMRHAVITFPPQKIEESRLIQRASAQLYDDIGIACQHHTEHYAHFQLLPKNIGTTDPEASFVRFNIAFTHDQSGAVSTLEPVWISVDSSFPQNTSEETSKVLMKSNEASNLSRTLNRKLESETLQPRKKVKTQKSVRFAENSPICPIARVLSPQRQQEAAPGSFVTSMDRHMNTPSYTALASKPPQHSSLPDFCIQHDFCHQLRKSCSYSRSPENKYIGYFQKSGPCKHLVYFAAPVAVHNYSRPESLASIIGEMADRIESEQFLEYERLRLARRLAEAVLQFHATPLLKDFWHGEDVIFFQHDERDDRASISISSPHLNVQVGSSRSPKAIARDQDPRDVDNITGHMIRNPRLFSLGVVLIELAVQAPLRSLYTSGDRVRGPPTALSDFLVASRLSQTMSSSLGHRYGTVVRKCLGCDFGQGTSDLSDERLQAAVYQDVVCELERLERGFAMLQLGA